MIATTIDRGVSYLYYADRLYQLPLALIGSAIGVVLLPSLTRALRGKRDEEAIWCYDRAIEADRKLTLAFLYKGGVYNRLGRYDDALRCYEQALHTAEDSA